MKNSTMNYLHKPAEKWVSGFVLLGCIAITGILLFSADQAHIWGAKFNAKDGMSDESNLMAQ